MQELQRDKVLAAAYEAAVAGSRTRWTTASRSTRTAGPAGGDRSLSQGAEGNERALSAAREPASVAQPHRCRGRAPERPDRRLHRQQCGRHPGRRTTAAPVGQRGPAARRRASAKPSHPSGRHVASFTLSNALSGLQAIRPLERGVEQCLERQYRGPYPQDHPADLGHPR